MFQVGVAGQRMLDCLEDTRKVLVAVKYQNGSFGFPPAQLVEELGDCCEEFFSPFQNLHSTMKILRSFTGMRISVFPE
jgi:hypothetical protein